MIDKSHVIEHSLWAAGYWHWSGERFLTLKEAKSFIDDAYPRSLRTMITKYDGYAHITKYDRNGDISSIVEIVADNYSYHGYHYGKPHKWGKLG